MIGSVGDLLLHHRCNVAGRAPFHTIRLADCDPSMRALLAQQFVPHRNGSNPDGWQLVGQDANAGVADDRTLILVDERPLRKHPQHTRCSLQDLCCMLQGAQRTSWILAHHAHHADAAKELVLHQLFVLHDAV